MYSDFSRQIGILKEAYENGNLAIVTGAGLSSQLKLPTMDNLIQELIKSSGENDEQLIKLHRECRYGDVIDELLKKTNITESYIQSTTSKIILENEAKSNLYCDNNYFDLRDMNKALFITFNYDNLLKKILEEKYDNIDEVLIGREIPNLQNIKRGKTIVYLHGQVNNPSSIILSNTSYKIYEEVCFKKQLETLISSKVLLFIGCSLNEDRFKKALLDIAKYCKNESYIILKKSNKDELENLSDGHDKLNISHIPIEGKEYTNEIREILQIITGVDTISLHKQLDNDIKNLFFNSVDIECRTGDYCTSDRFKMIIEKELTFILFNRSSKIFRCLIESNNKLITQNLRQCSDVYLFFKKMIYKSNSQIPFKILGENGVGKTKFMFFFYFYLMREYYLDSRENYYPIYINLDIYTQYKFLKEIEDKKESSVKGKIVSSIIKNIDSALNKVNNNRGVVILIDGFDELINIKSSIEQAIESYLIKKESVVKKVIGISEKKSKRENNIDEFEQEEIYTIKPIGDCLDISESLLRDYIELINYECGYNGHKTDNIISCIKRLRLLEINFFVINLVINYFYKAHNPQDISLSKLYSWYWNKKSYEFEHEDKDSLEQQLEQIAYDTFVNNDDKYTIKFEELINNPEFYILNKQKNFFEYFIAKHMVRNLDLFVGYALKNENIFSYTVYSFCKSLLLDKNEQLELQTYNKIKAAYEVDGNISNLAIYLLGRVHKEETKNAAIILLSELLKKLLITDKQKYKFQIRSCYISLSYLGEKEYSEQYILELMNNPEWDKLNNGFYLEYYGDLEGDVFYRNDLHTDKLKPFPRTFKMLKNSLEKNLLQPDLDTLFDIKLYTLCSLVQKRLYDWKGKCGFDSGEYINVLINIKDNKNKILFDKLYNYLKMIILHSSYNNFSPTLIFKDILDFIFYKRRGWRDRKIENPESILEHIANCVIKALILLPEETDAQRTEKLEVMKILAYHDIPEISTGDIRTGKSDKYTRDTQQQYSHYLSVLCTYPFINGFSDFHDHWNKYESMNEDRCYQSARSIDKIDSWFRAVHYKSIGMNIDYKDFENDILNDIEDKYLQETFSKYFRDPYKDLSSSSKTDIMIIKFNRNIKIDNNTVSISKKLLGNIDYTKIGRLAIFKKNKDYFYLLCMYKVIGIDFKENDVVVSVISLEKLLLKNKNRYKSDEITCKYLDRGIMCRLYSSEDFENGLIDRF